MYYTWIDLKTDFLVEVTRSMDESDVPPDKPEALEAGMEVEDYALATWKKYITGGLGHVGFGMKGAW